MQIIHVGRSQTQSGPYWATFIVHKNALREQFSESKVDVTASPQKTELPRKAILSIKHVVKPLGGRDTVPNLTGSQQHS